MRTGRILKWTAIGALFTLPALAAPQEDLRQAYEYELTTPPGDWIVVGNHYRHTNNCAAHGCVVMGPMNDKDACEQWAKDYNRHDPLDHTRCVDASDYEVSSY